MKDIVQGRVAIVLGDNINADKMVPPSHLWVRDPEPLGKVALTNIDPDFPKKAKPGDIVVAGKNFGFGHLHLAGVIAFMKLGISAVVVESVAPGWHRGAIAAGLPVLTCHGITKSVSAGDELRLDLKTGKVENVSRGATLNGEPVAPILMEILRAGGTTAYVDRKLKVA